MANLFPSVTAFAYLTRPEIAPDFGTLFYTIDAANSPLVSKVPPAAEELTAQGGCESVWLQWKDTRRDDACGFKVLRSTDGKSFSVNSATTRSAAFDGKIDTYFDAAQSDGAWAGIDLGEERAARVTKISYCPRQNLPQRMTGGRFQAADNPSRDPKYAKYTITALSNQCGFRSRTPFRVAFKKFTGMTPKEWMKGEK